MSNTLNFSIGAELKELDRSLSKASSAIKDFAEKNEARFNKVGSAMQDIGKKASILSGAIVAGAGAMLLLAKNVGNVADRLLDLSDITGMSTDAIQEYQYVAKIAGVSTESVTSAVEGLTRRLGSMSEDASAAEKVLSKLGISTKTTGGDIRAAGDIMDETLLKLADMENITERNVLGAQLFGGAWKDLAPILSMGSDGIEKAREEARSLGVVMSEDALNAANEFRQGMVKLGAQFEGMKNQIGAKLAPVLNNTLIPLFQNKIMPMLLKVSDYIIKMIEGFNNLSPTVKKIIGVVTGLVVAFGPLMAALGTVVKFLPLILKGLALLTGPIGLTVLAIAAITAIVIKNWTTVKRWAEGLINYFIDLYNESIVFRAGIEAIALNFKNMFAVGKFIFQSLWTIIKAVVSQIVNQFKLLGGVIDAVLTFSPSKLKKSLSDYRKAITENVSGIIDAVGNDFNELTDSIVGNVETAINNVLTGKKEHVKFESDKKSLEKLEGDVATAVSDGVAKGLSGEARRPQIQGIAGGLQSLGIIDINIEPLREKMREIGDLVTAEMVYLKQLMMDFDAETRELIFSSIADTFSGLGEVIGNALAEGGNVLQAIGRSILNSMGQFLSSFGDQLIKYSIAALAFDRIKKSLFSGLGTPGAAAAGIAAGVALKALGSAISAGQSGGIGGGGATSSTPNVSSSSTFRSGATGGQNEFVFRIAGRDLVSVIDRNRQNTERIAG